MSTATEVTTTEATPPAATEGWTCIRCAVTSRWMPGHERAGAPAGWARVEGEPHCLRCRRAHVAELAVLDAAADTDRAERAKLRAAAILEFEIRRDPERPNGEIAKAVRCSVPAVVKMRRRLETGA